MVTKQTKKSPIGNRVLSPHTQEGISTSVSPGIDGKKKGYANIWPEWNDSDINSEKWMILNPKKMGKLLKKPPKETSHKGGKEKEKGKSPVSLYFDDPQGKIELPNSLRVDHWKRPHDYIIDMSPVIVDQNRFNWFDLFTSNDHIHHSELIRYIISEIIALWYHGRVKAPVAPPGEEPLHVDPAMPTDGEFIYSWRPWEHIYSINKVVKGPTIPVYNQYGKYAVKLYFLGCWRKILVDDTLPCNDLGEILLPITSRSHELWPLLLTKALIKVASLDYNGGNSNCEFGDFSVINCLTGWLPETIPLQFVSHSPRLWSLLKSSLPNFKLPELAKPIPGELTSISDNDNKNITPNPSEEKAEKSPKPDSKPSKPKSDKDKKQVKNKANNKKKGKDGKDKKQNDKDSKKEKSMIQDEIPLPEHPEYVVFASYSGPPKYPSRISALSDCATTSENLRIAGFSPAMSHPIVLKQCRDCPLEPPPIIPPVPAWKLIRPRKPRVLPSAEPLHDADHNNQIQSIEISSPYIHFKSATISIPTDTHRPNSTLTKGGTHISRPNTAGYCSSILEEDAATRSNVNLQLNADPLDAVQSPISRIEETMNHTPSTDVDTDKKISISGDKNAKNRVEPDQSAKSKATSASKRTKKLLSVDVTGKNSKSPISNATDVELESNEEYESTVPSPLSHVNLMWMDFDTFCKCFNTLTIYHLPHSYPFSSKYSDIKTEKVTDEKPDNFIFVDNLQPTELIISFSALSQWPELPTPPKPMLAEESKATTNSQTVKREMRESRAETWTNDISSIPEATSITDMNSSEPLTAGILIAEPYSWRTVITGQPMLRIKTTSVKTIMLTLPAGLHATLLLIRHVLKFIMQSPLGCHLNIVSTVNFVFGDEEKVMAELSMESVRFANYACQLMHSISRCVAHFNDAEMYASAKKELLLHHCPHIDISATYRDKDVSMRSHLEIFNESFYMMLRKALCIATAPTPGDKSTSTVCADQSVPSLASSGQQAYLNGDVATAWRAFNFDPITPNILGLPYGTSSRPTTGMTSDRGSAKKGVSIKKKDTIESKTELWRTREPTIDELVACVKIQKTWRCYWVRNLCSMNKRGTDDNCKAHELLMKSWAVLEQNIEQNALFLFRNMFKLSPDLISKFPFYKDEWNKMVCTDYQGIYPEQPANTWFILFREIFIVQESMLCLPKLICSLNTSHLRVIDNDTGKELPEIFFKVAPYIFKRNIAGYTFIGEARTQIECGLPSGKWKLRLISSLTPLPVPIKSELTSSFSLNEFRDYYIPNENNILLRYSVKVTEDHLASIQLSTSKPDIYLQLKIYENDIMVISSQGKGHVVLPAYIFKKDIIPNFHTSEDDDTSRKHGTKRGNSAASHKISGSQNMKKRTGSSIQDVRNSSRTSTHQSVGSVEDSESDAGVKIYKYMIEATVMNDSWPLSEIQWMFVQGLIDAESQEIKVGTIEKVPEAEVKVTSSKESATSKSKEKPGKKDAKKADKDTKNLVSRPSSQNFDANKPNYILRIVSDSNAMDDITIEKDKERVNQIRAMKVAWEAAEPGRAAKALQSRLKFLESHLIKSSINQENETDKLLKTENSELTPEVIDTLRPLPDEPSPDASITLTLKNPNPPEIEDQLIPLDVSQFRRHFFSKYQAYESSLANGQQIYLDNVEESRQREIRQNEIAKYKEYRKSVENRRHQELVKRNKQKKADFEDYANMQLSLDEARRMVNIPRNKLRDRMLAEEKQINDDIAAKQAAIEAELNKPSTPKGKKSAKAKSGGKKK